MSAPKMGLGLLGDTQIVFKPRRFRWTVEATFPAASFGPQFVKVQARPSLAHPDPDNEINYLSAKTWIPDKAHQNVIVTTFYDLHPDPAKDKNTEAFFDVLRSVYDFTEKKEGEEKKKVEGTLRLKMYTGIGDLLEEWILSEAWPTEVNFGELDHSSTECYDIEVTWRYKSIEYVPHTPTLGTVLPKPADGQVEPLLGGKAE